MWIVREGDSWGRPPVTRPCTPTGYLAIGFSDVAGKMGPADAYVGWVDGNGEQGGPAVLFVDIYFPIPHSLPLPHSFPPHIRLAGVEGRLPPRPGAWDCPGDVVKVVDFSTNRRTINAADAQQDCSEVSGSQTKSGLTFSFTRRLDTKVWAAI